MLTKGIEQALSIVGLGGDDEMVVSFAFKVLDIAAIIYRIAAHEHLNQLLLRHKESQAVLLVLRNAEALGEIADEDLLYYRVWRHHP